MIHGDILKGTLSYWVGAFNGKGPLAANTTSEPEVIVRGRVYPFRLAGDSPLQGLAFGGAYGHGRTRGLSNEMSFSGFVPDRPFALVPQTLINGPVERVNAEATFLLGPLGIRAEYDKLLQRRRALDVGFTDLPTVRAYAFNIDGTFLLTGQPKATSPLFGRDGSFGIGAWEVKARYSYLNVNAPGDPANGFPNIGNSVDELSAGLNWYPTNLVRYALDFNLYRVKDAATVGGALPQNFLVVLQRVQFKF
jgi:phosphate-selective porin